MYAVHNYEFPSVLWKLDRYGKLRGEYWSNGHISDVKEGRYKGRRVMLVGAMDNERVTTSLAVLDYENPSGFAPSEDSKYRCENCPNGEPLAFLLFPQTEMSREFKTRPIMSQMRVQTDGTVTITVLQTVQELRGQPAGSGADVWYTLDERLQLVEAETGDTYRRLHSQPELMGRLKHGYGPKCEEQIFPLRFWKGKTFVELPRPKRREISTQRFVPPSRE
jgi:hypothetical protein